jgi:hypothetical protein
MPAETKVAAPFEASTRPQHVRQSKIQRWFYISVGIVVILLGIAGFGPSLIDQSRRFAPITTSLIAHGASTAAWLVLFLSQATLVATGRVAVHRRLGWIGPAIVAAIVVFGVLITIEGAFRVSDLSGDVTRLWLPPGAPPPTEAEAITGIWGPLGVLLDFSILVAAGLWFRHRPEVHKRIMVFSLVPLAFESIMHLSGALVGRVPAPQSVLIGIWLTASLLLLAVPAIHDKVSTRRIHPVSVWLPILYVAWFLLCQTVIFKSDAAFNVAAWILRH